LAFERLREDIATVMEKDPAARSPIEVLLSYPGIHALAVHRLAHRFWLRGFYHRGPLAVALGAVPHRHRDSPGRDHRPSRVHRPWHGCGGGRDR
jgi:hypothetical protein